MKRYAITYTTVLDERRTVYRVAGSEETALQSFWFWNFHQEGVLAAKAGSAAEVTGMGVLV